MTNTLNESPIQTICFDPGGLEARIWHNTTKEGTFNVSFYDAASGQYMSSGYVRIESLDEAVEVATKALKGA